MNNIDLLMNFGLTRHEARIYTFLFSEGKLNGYEVAKITGISRSNTYTALAGLVDKGAAYTIEENSVYYVPVPVEEFCNNKIRYMNDIKNKLINSMPKKRNKVHGYISIKGEQNILNKLNNMINDAKERVYLCLSLGKLEKYRNQLQELVDKKIKVVIITDFSFDIKGAKVYYSNINEKTIRVIVDSQHVLTGEIEDKDNSTCLYSSNNNLVEVFKESLSNKIKLIEINKGD